MVKTSLFPVNVRALKYFQAVNLIFPLAAKTVNALQIFVCAQALTLLECATLPLPTLISIPVGVRDTLPLIIVLQYFILILNKDDIATLKRATARQAFNVPVTVNAFFNRYRIMALIIQITNNLRSVLLCQV